MARLPSFNYNAINARGGIAEGLGGLTAALIQAPQEKRRLALAEQDRIERRSMGEQDLVLRRQALEDRQQSEKAAGERDVRDFTHRQAMDQGNLAVSQQNAMTLGASRIGGAINDFQKGGGLIGALVGAPKTGGRTPGPNDDVIPPHILANLEKQLDDQDAAMKASGGLSATGMLPGVRANARQQLLKNAGYNPVTMRRLGAGNINAAGQPATPQQAPTPSQQPSAAPNQNVGQSDADILQLKAQHPQYATIPDDEFIRRVRAKNQGK